MAKKERKALFFVRKVTGNKEILFAVVGMPERTTAPAETAHYILFSGNKNKRYKMKINTCIYSRTQTGKTDRTKVEKFTPNFEKIEGKLLEEMYKKCCPAFKKAFSLNK